jgi:hypothetical protein
MWILLPTGFLSVVAHREAAHLVLVRSRERAPIDRVIERLTDQGIHAGPAFLDARADYPHRLILPRAAWGAFLALEVRDLVATNMKAEAEATRGIDRYTRALHDVWRVLWDAFSPDRPRQELPAWSGPVGPADDDPDRWSWDPNR